ncbi:hypothetical protein SAMCCGM7_Ch1825 [Sinorhizobium americanum CCGM7]|nr:hypothetical protein SAMCCGM7_Ch1825 [Sinorhizobium americanum CCGM7]
MSTTSGATSSFGGLCRRLSDMYNHSLSKKAGADAAPI